MPYTINGIGTTYVGKKNRSATVGSCEFCGRTVTLSSFDTREVICVIYVPLIPLRKFRIINQCASCRKHYRLAYAEFQQQLTDNLEPLRQAVQRSPLDVDARLALIHGYSGYSLTSDASEAAEAAVQALPNDVWLCKTASYFAALRADQERAIAHLDRAVSLDPRDAEARVSLGHLNYTARRYDEAVRQLEESRRFDSSNQNAALLLGESYLQLGRWSEALGVLQPIAMETGDKGLLRKVGECKTKLGWPLNDDERRASRRWWPFGGGTKQPKPLRKPDSFDPKQLIIATVLVALVIGGFVVAGWYQGNHVDVWFDSVTPALISVDGGTPFAITSPSRQQLAPGSHEVVVRDAKGKELEKATVDVERQGVWDALFDQRLYVYNVGAQRVYRHADVGYATSAEDASYAEVLIGNQRFFDVKDVDYVFTPPPEQVRMSSGAKKETKVLLDVAEGLTLAAFGDMRVGEGALDEAEAAYRTAVAWQPCDSAAEHGLAFLKLHQKKVAETVTLAKKWMADCPNQYVESSRVYQGAREMAGEREAVMAEYRERVAADPSNAANHYLYGRMLTNFDESVREHREAIRLDPKFSWAHLALGYELLGNGLFTDAMGPLAKSVEMRPGDSNALGQYVSAAIASGRTADVWPALEKALSTPQIDDITWTAKWSLLLAEEQWPAARVYNDARPDPDGAVERRLQLAQLMNDTAAVDALLKEAGDRKALAFATAAVRYERHIAASHPAEAASAFDAAAEKLGDSGHRAKLYAAAALMLNGDKAAAQARVAAVKKAVNEGPAMDGRTRRIFNAFMSALEGGSQQSVIDEIRDIDTSLLKDAWFFLGARAAADGDAVRARRNFAMSAAMSFDLRFPMLAARSLAKG